MLGRESEMTLFWGEQVMPCHEHGVCLDGSHEDSTEEEEEDCFAGRRERRAWPSEDKEVTNKIFAMVM